MPKLQDIPALLGDAAELLEAVGYLDTEDLAEADASELHAELVKANEKLHILPDTPTVEDLKKWQDDLSSKIAEPEEEEEEFAEDEPEHDEDEEAHVIEMEPGVSNFENDQEVMDMLDVSPEAEPLIGSLIKRHKLAVSDIPEGILLTAWEGELEINVMNSTKPTDSQRRLADAKRTGLMTARIRGFDDMDSGDHVVKPLDRGEPRESVSVSGGLNLGIDPTSRRFVRGVMHPDPLSVKTSAFFSMLVQLMLVASFIGIPWLLIHEHMTGDSMLYWVIGLASGLVLSAFCYLFWGMSARCRVCGQRQFAPKKCLKNKKAHHIPLVGYIFPTAIHALFYRWFYCTYCGTAVRLKK